MEPQITLILSVGALVVGPLMAGLLHRRASLHAFLDGFILVMVGGLALLHLLPHAFTTLGLWAVPLAMVGIFLPLFAERRLHLAQEGETTWFLLAAMIGLILHASLDGATLAAHADEFVHGHGEGEEGLGLGLAILLHRLPVGLLVWWSVRPRLGHRNALTLLVAVAAATVVGYFLSAQLAPLSGGLAWGVLTALLAGGLLHVVLEHHHHDHHCAEEKRNGWSAMGACVGVVLFALLPEAVPTVLGRAVSNMSRLFFESGFAIFLGFFGAGLLTMVPARSLARFMTGRNSFTSSLRGIIFGLPLPICSCGVVPLYRSLHQKKVSAAAAMAFLVATPELGIDAVLISIPLLGMKLTVIRLAAAAVVALVAGIVAGMITRESSPAPAASSNDADAKGNSFRQAMDFGLRESVDDLAPWIVAGIVVAGLLEPLLQKGLVASVPALAQIPLFGALATPFYICASGATPIAAVFLAKGVSAGAVVAFLLTGPATNVTTFGAIRSVHRLGATIALVLTVPIASILLGGIIHTLAGSVAAPSVLEGPVESVGLLQIAGVVIFGALLIDSMFRKGPRAFLRQLGIGRHAQVHEAEAKAAMAVKDAAPSAGQA